MDTSTDAPPPDTIKALIDLWPTRATCAHDVGVTKSRVDKWAQSNSIPARYHRRVVESAKVRGFAGVSADLLADLHAQAFKRDAA